MDLNEYYEQQLKARGYEADDAQKLAIKRLQFYETKLNNTYYFFETLWRYWKHWINKKSEPNHFYNGLYLWGGVGRGKSFLMDCFYHVIPEKRKIRIHFHEFMRDIHRQLEILKGSANPLDEVAQRISKKYRLICFDEFHVSDIADAMILYRLLKCLFKNGLQLIATSNNEPDQLYLNGLHRDRFLPAIQLLKNNLEIINVDAGMDYRQRALKHMSAYFLFNEAAVDKKLATLFDQLASGQDEIPLLHIENREIPAVRLAGCIVWFNFDVICSGPRSQNDYLEIASRFSDVIVSNVPQMSVNMSSAARRFTWLIDVLYDHRIKVFISAETQPEQLYILGPLASEFKRTVSRINEMQTQTYLQAQKRMAVSLY